MAHIRSISTQINELLEANQRLQILQHESDIRCKETVLKDDLQWVDAMLGYFNSSFDLAVLENTTTQKLKTIFTNTPHNTVIELTGDILHNLNFDNILIQIINELQSNPNIIKIKLINLRITDEVAIKLSQIVNTLPNLVEIDLSYNLIEEQGAISLFKCLMHNTSVISLNLQANKIDSASIQDLKELIKHNKFLKSINLSCCRLNKSDLVSILDSLQENNTLVELRCHRQISGVRRLSYSVHLGALKKIEERLTVNRSRLISAVSESFLTDQLGISDLGKVELSQQLDFVSAVALSEVSNKLNFAFCSHAETKQDQQQDATQVTVQRPLKKQSLTA